MSGYRRIVMARHPAGLPVREDFALIEGDLPAVADGQVLVAHSYLGLAPAARIRMSATPLGYAAPTPIGGTVYGAAVGQVVDSRNSAFSPGDHVVSIDGGWQTHGLSDGSNLKPIDPDLAPPMTWLGAMGTSGFTAYVGLLEVGRAKAGETIVVSAAGGAVGSLVGQIARLTGCHAIGIAGGAEKCCQVEDTFGLTRCVDYRSSSFADDLAQACPDGIDVYFDNVGGMVRDTVWPLMALFGRIPVCGQISRYNDPAAATGPDWYSLLTRSITVRGFLVTHHPHLYDGFRSEMSEWIKNGDIVTRDHVVHGLERTPDAFIGMLSGANFGKAVVRL